MYKCTATNPIQASRLCLSSNSSSKSANLAKEKMEIIIAIN